MITRTSDATRITHHPQSHDVRAHLSGGVPKAEVVANAALFEAHGFDPMGVLVERDEGYYDFSPALNGNGDLKQVIESDSGIKDCEEALLKAFGSWWSGASGKIASLPESKALTSLRADLLANFEEVLVPVGLLDRFQVAGAVASWWGGVVFDLKTLMTRGFDGVVEGWVTTIITAVEDGSSKDQPLDHKLVRRLLPESGRDWRGRGTGCRTGRHHEGCYCHR